MSNNNNYIIQIHVEVFIYLTFMFVYIMISIFFNDEEKFILKLHSSLYFKIFLVIRVFFMINWDLI